MHVITPTTGDGHTRAPSTDTPRNTKRTDIASTLVLPAHPTSLRLGRQATLDWLQLAPQHYDQDTVLLLVTELLVNALEYSRGPLVLSVCEVDDRIRVEVTDAAPADGPLEASELDRVTGEGRHLKMIKVHADRAGMALRLVNQEAPIRVVWFECLPVGPPRLVVV